MARLRPGSTIGELALRFASAPRTATVRARSETCAVACVHRDAFAAIVAEEHDAIEAEACARDLEREKRRRARRRRRGRKKASPTEGAALERSTVDPDELARFFASYFSRNDDDTRRKGASRSSAPRRALSAWEAELLRATLTVATFEPGDACPVAEPAERAPTRGAADASRTSSNEPEHLRTNDGLDRRRVYDVEDGFVGLVLSGEVVTVDAADAREVASRRGGVRLDRVSRDAAFARRAPRLLHVLRRRGRAIARARGGAAGPGPEGSPRDVPSDVPGRPIRGAEILGPAAEGHAEEHRRLRGGRGRRKRVVGLGGLGGLGGGGRSVRRKAARRDSFGRRFESRRVARRSSDSVSDSDASEAPTRAVCVPSS